MSDRQGSPEFEIQIGEHGATTAVGIKPPVPNEQLVKALKRIPEREKPDRVSRMGDEDDEAGAYTVFEFLHPHFGAYRNTYAERVVEALKSVLNDNGTVVKIDEETKSLHGDHQLFE